VKEVFRKSRASVESIARRISANRKMVLVTLDKWRLILNVNRVDQIKQSITPSDYTLIMIL
jgi:hypothetical protein